MDEQNSIIFGRFPRFNQISAHRSHPDPDVQPLHSGCRSSAMTCALQEFATSLLRQVGQRRPADFTGLGVVFYETLSTLPFLALEGPSANRFALPISGIEHIASTLAGASSASSGSHDGFHFVNPRTAVLTHLAQFLSPPLPQLQADVPAPRASGARHMTALLASQVAGIDGIGLLTVDGESALYVGGAQTLRLKIT